jgi:RNA polymerase sigma factor (sigma-70 family)
MPHENELSQLLHRVRQGQEGAAEELVSRYGPQVLRVVRRSLNRKLRSKFDSLDFVQAVWASFFAQVGYHGQCQDLQDVAAYLRAMAHHKTIDEVRRHLRTRTHGVQREAGWDAPVLSSVSKMTSEEPGPSELAAAHEAWDQLTTGRSNRSIQVFELRRDGATYPEIAERLGVNERTVRRILERAERRLAADDAPAAPPAPEQPS